MRGKEFNEKPACAYKSMPFPTEVTCPQCGAEIEIWSDEDQTACRLCGYVVFNHERYIN
ncbi:MAG: hypothetical protein GXO99_01595 [Nitrospirae bacterium]|nr:hypothetical protein [Nitrospirota bacterium]